MKKPVMKPSGSRVDLCTIRALDVILIVLILLGSAGWLLGSSLNGTGTSSHSKEVLIFRDGTLTDRFAVAINREIVLGEGHMVLDVRDSKVRVKHSECRRQCCVNQGWVAYDGESIVCVPHKTVIEIQSASGPVLDAVIY